MKKIRTGVLLALLAFSSSTVFADNDQTLVIGLSAGIHNFSTTDDIRRGVYLFDDLTFAGASDAYIEWYVFEKLGVGLRLNSLGVTEDVYSYYGSYSREVAVSNSFITVNWIPFGATSYARFGILAGVGRSEYEYTETSGGVSMSASSSGTATLYGGFLDWGGERFGARLSYNILSTDLDDLLGYHVDASGAYTTFDLRFAIE